MMRTYVESTYYLEPADMICVSGHGDGVSFHLSPFATKSQQGFSIHLRVEHIPQVERLLLDLVKLRGQLAGAAA